MYNWLLDKSIYFSFDRSGFERHAKEFDEINRELFANKNVLITGGTSGIGEALGKRLIDSKAKLIVTGRSENKFKKSILHQDAKFIELDMNDFEAFDAFVDELNVIDYFVCNAGGMPENLKIINNKYDLIFASQVVGHYKLIETLHRKNKLSQNACIHLNSSGGMYPVKLDLSDLKWENKQYDKVASYANAKRAQVILCEELPKLFEEYYFSCSHPGWVGTDAVKESIPGFYHFTKKRLRTSDQGCDTIHWCLAQRSKIVNGGFYFDRMLKDPYPFFWTKESQEERNSLLELITR